MKIIINGKEKEIKSKSIPELINELNLIVSSSAIAVNYTVIKKSSYSEAHLKEGDRVDIVQAVQGG